MKNEEIAYLAQYCSPRSILVVTWYGKLKILKCPFPARVNKKIGDLEPRDLVKVEAVKLSKTGKTIYKIRDLYYPYSYFDLILAVF